jgi:uncharacterized protein (TIGR00730 family)
MRRICIYCGSNFGSNPAFRDAAERIGKTLATRGIGVVYGGGSVGLMGVVADSALAAGGEVIGVIPRKLMELEKGHHGLTQMFQVETMHERKKLMMDHADGFIALPGGYGTMEELFEAVAWLQLGYHQKPVGLLNVANYFDPLLTMLNTMEQDGLLKPQHRALLLIDDDLDALLAKMEAFTPPDADKWL